MPRGDNPNSRKNLKKGHPFNEETARIANKKSRENAKAYKPLREWLKEQCTDEDRRQMNENLIRMAKRNIRAYEMLMRALGEDPGDKLEVTGTMDIADAFAAAVRRRDERKAKEEKAGDSG